MAQVSDEDETAQTRRLESSSRLFEPDTVPPAISSDDSDGLVEDEPDTLRPDSGVEPPPSNRFAGRPAIQAWSLESMRRSFDTWSGGRGSTRRKLILATSYLLVFASGALAHRAMRGPPRAFQVGRIGIHSTPDGALVFVNGETVPVEGAEGRARTPLQAITRLRYGSRYDIRLEKQGFEPWRATFVMGPDIDGTVLDARLEPK
jgi:hypothetical protein